MDEIDGVWVMWVGVIAEGNSEERLQKVTD